MKEVYRIITKLQTSRVVVVLLFVYFYDLLLCFALPISLGCFPLHVVKPEFGVRTLLGLIKLCVFHIVNAMY